MRGQCADAAPRTASAQSREVDHRSNEEEPPYVRHSPPVNARSAGSWATQSPGHERPSPWRLQANTCGTPVAMPRGGCEALSQKNMKFWLNITILELYISANYSANKNKNPCFACQTMKHSHFSSPWQCSMMFVFTC